MKFLQIGLIVLLGILGLGWTALRILFGGGERYPDITSPPLFDESVLEVVATLQEPVGNVAVSRTGRIFITIHPESRPQEKKLVEWVHGQAIPFPNSRDQTERFQTILGIVIDPLDRLWIIDHGNHGVNRPQLSVLDINSRQYVVTYRFTRDVAPMGSLLQDLQVDPTGRYAFIADVGFWNRSPGIIVFDREERKSHRILSNHSSVRPQNWIIHNPIKKMEFLFGALALKAGVDGLALDTPNGWLYYGAMTNGNLYRIPIQAALMDSPLIEETVELYSQKPLSDGFSMDKKGNVYVTDVEHGGVVRVTTRREVETLIKSERIRWADALSFGPNKTLFIADSAIPDQMLRSKDHIRSRAPYYVFKYQNDIAGHPGQ